ncbi:MAG: hypothetical protein H6813_03710 [Phycisphaeraceae bacterium]|nr:hypothetical protein [Phycisphaeraceae bacterium]MCB9847054.1 hypothetical protein [Phycisphaeraceae bacterium]
MLARTLLLLGVFAASIGCASHNIGPNLGIGAIAGRGVGAGQARIAVRSGEGVGKGIGYLIADKLDQEHAQSLTRASVHNNYSHSELGALTNTRWSVRTITPPDAAGGENLGMVVTFRPSGHVVTRTILPDSSTRLVTERYRVVGDTVIINGDDYVINAQFRIRGESLTIAAGNFVGVFDRIRTRDGL